MIAPKLAVVALAVLLARSASAQRDDFDEGDIERESRMQRNHSDRPLTLPRDLFAVNASVGGGQFTKSAGYIGFGAGADYGINDDLEVGLELLLLSLSSVPQSGFADPRLSLTYRFTRGVFELGGRGALSIPLRSSATFGLSFPMLLRFAPYARLDLLPQAVVFGSPSGSSTPFQFAATANASLRVQLGDAFSLGPIAAFSMPDLRKEDVSARLGGRLTYTFGKKRTGDADLSISALSPAIALSGERPAEPSTDRFFSVLVDLRVFIEDTFDSPFDEEL